MSKSDLLNEKNELDFEADKERKWLGKITEIYWRSHPNIRYNPDKNYYYGKFIFKIINVKNNKTYDVYVLKGSLKDDNGVIPEYYIIFFVPPSGRKLKLNTYFEDSKTSSSLFKKVIEYLNNEKNIFYIENGENKPFTKDVFKKYVYPFKKEEEEPKMNIDELVMREYRKYITTKSFEDLGHAASYDQDRQVCQIFEEHRKRREEIIEEFHAPNLPEKEEERDTTVEDFKKSCFCGKVENLSQYEVLFWPDAPEEKQRLRGINICSKKCAMSWTARYIQTCSFDIKKHISGTDWLLGNLISKEEFEEYQSNLYSHPLYKSF